MGNILHDWDEETKLKLMRKAYDALPAGGVLSPSKTSLIPTGKQMFLDCDEPQYARRNGRRL